MKPVLPGNAKQVSDSGLVPVIRDRGDRVPVRTIVVTIGLVLATAVALLFLIRGAARAGLALIALFFTIALYPVVGWVQRRMTGDRGPLATLWCSCWSWCSSPGLLTVFAVPLAREGSDLRRAAADHRRGRRAGRGPSAGC